MKIEDCIGCNTYELYVINKSISSYKKFECNAFNKKLVCPCSICLVKGMCSRSCGEFNKHRRNIVLNRFIKDCKNG